jgi:enoyl-CoA hydratase
MDYRFVDIDINEGIATLSLNRVERLNALSLEFASEIARAVQEVDSNDQVMVIIVKSGSEKAFCAGLDLQEFMSLGLDGRAKSSLNFPYALKDLFDCCNALEASRKPVIAAVQGACIGGGLDIISACDIRLCTEDATFSLREAAIGLVADMGVLQRLPLIIGQGYTREMALTARFYSAREAERMGLVNAVYSDGATLSEAALALARQIGENAPLAVQATKEVLNYSRNVSVGDGMALAMNKNMVLFSSEDLMEAATAFKERKKPAFKGR